MSESTHPGTAAQQRRDAATSAKWAAVTAPRSFAVCPYCGFTNSAHADNCVRSPQPMIPAPAPVARQSIPVDQLPAVNAARLAYDNATTDLGRAWDRLNEEARILGLLFAMDGASTAALDGQREVVVELRSRADVATDTARAAKAARDALLAPWGWDR